MNVLTTREDLLDANEKDLNKLVALTQRKRNPLCGEDAIGLAVGQVIGRHKMQKHFERTISENSLSNVCREVSNAAEAALDDLYMTRTCVNSILMTRTLPGLRHQKSPWL